MHNPRLKPLIVMILIAATSRLFPHSPNLTPIAAMAVFGGATLANKRAAFLVPLGFVISDRHLAEKRWPRFAEPAPIMS